MMGDTNPTPADAAGSPADEYDRRQAASRDLIQRWISRLNLWWLLGQVATLGLFCISVLGVVEGVGWPILMTIVVWGLSIASAGAAAFATVWNWSILPVAWKAVGLAPMLIQLAEATLLAINLA